MCLQDGTWFEAGRVQLPTCFTRRLHLTPRIPQHCLGVGLTYSTSTYSRHSRPADLCWYCVLPIATPCMEFSCESKWVSTTATPRCAKVLSPPMKKGGTDCLATCCESMHAGNVLFVRNLACATEEPWMEWCRRSHQRSEKMRTPLASGGRCAGATSGPLLSSGGSLGLPLKSPRGDQ